MFTRSRAWQEFGYGITLRTVRRSSRRMFFRLWGRLIAWLIACRRLSGGALVAAMLRQAFSLSGPPPRAVSGIHSGDAQIHTVHSGELHPAVPPSAAGVALGGSRPASRSTLFERSPNPSMCTAAMSLRLRTSLAKAVRASSPGAKAEPCPSVPIFRALREIL